MAPMFPFAMTQKSLNWLHRLWVSMFSTLHMAVAIADPAMAWTSAQNVCTSFTHRSFLGTFSQEVWEAIYIFLLLLKILNTSCFQSVLWAFLFSTIIALHVSCNHVTQCLGTNLKSALQQQKSYFSLPKIHLFEHMVVVPVSSQIL